MRIAVIGARGQLGSDLNRQLGSDAVLFNRPEFDLTDDDSVSTALDATRPQAVINTAAYNLVDQAEEEPEVAFAVNALGPRLLAIRCEERGIPLVHVSTDYVFGLAGQRSTAYVEDDAPGPLSAYAISKLAGEHFVRGLCRRHMVVRTCGLYGRADGGQGNFVATMLRLGQDRSELRVVDDQHCTPTSTSDLARWLIQLVETEAYGLYHASNAGSTTWCQFAREIFRIARFNVEVLPITSSEFGAKAQRPPYSVLNCDRLSEVLGQPLRPWQDALQEYLETSPT